jgi:hypothetical protein
MRRAVIELVGNIAPTAFGPSIQPLKKRISSSNLAASFLPSCPAILTAPIVVIRQVYAALDWLGKATIRKV